MKKHIKDLEKRLRNAYDSGFFDGYHEGVDDTHIIWIEELMNVKGVGEKLRVRILTHMTKAMKRRQQERNLQKNELSEEVKGYE